MSHARQGNGKGGATVVGELQASAGGLSRLNINPPSNMGVTSGCEHASRGVLTDGTGCQLFSREFSGAEHSRNAVFAQTQSP